MRLDDIAQKHGADKSSKGHNYCRVYELYLARLRFDDITLLEIGVAGGASIRMWLDYFPRAKVFGMDVGDVPPTDHPRYTFVKANATSVSTWDSIPEVDVVVDDGSHHSADMWSAYSLGWKRVKQGGLWIIEDLHCAYDTFYSPKERPTMIDMGKAIVNEMNDFGKSPCGDPRQDQGSAAFVHFWKSLIIIGKKLSDGNAI